MDVLDKRFALDEIVRITIEPLNGNRWTFKGRVTWLDAPSVSRQSIGKIKGVKIIKSAGMPFSRAASVVCRSSRVDALRTRSASVSK